VLIFPLLDKVIVGTSDIPIENPDDARSTDEEVNYFLEMIWRVFPNIKLKHEQIVFRFSGVRPLAYSDAKTTGQITPASKKTGWTTFRFIHYLAANGPATAPSPSKRQKKP